MTTFAPPNPPYLGPAAHDSGLGNKPIHRIVIHATVSPCVEGQARRVAAWFRDPDSRGSAHYVIDPGEVVQVVLDSRIAWHAPPNPHSIGVELCDALISREWDRAHRDRWRDENHTRMLRRASRIVARLCLAYDVPIERLNADDLRAGRRGITGHDDVSKAWGESSHWDPGAFFPWAEFVQHVERRAAKMRKADR